MKTHLLNIVLLCLTCFAIGLTVGVQIGARQTGTIESAMDRGGDPHFLELRGWPM